MREIESRTSERRRPDRADVALAIWIGLLGVGIYDRRALYVALLYAVPYLINPAVRQMTGGGAQDRRAADLMGRTLLALSIGAAALGLAVGFGGTWALVSGIGAVTGGALLLVDRAR
jgi:hypothetical protein